ncbi:hypothetical protein [Sorangium cellulosum]|uniref:hypothetical protein n=1 Tax=Sorangium cellulosum TaxID=56 RepID=UPI0011DDC06A|nr:hypothetical protein [Sorangium cellulosum]
MLTYIKDIAAELERAADSPSARNIFDLAKALSEELDRLDPRDFSPAVRTQFAMYRMEARNWARATSFSNTVGLKKFTSGIPGILDGYGLPGRATQNRAFRWLSDPDLAGIIARDYVELNQILVPDGAWKSAVILAGSILEAIFLDLLTKDPTRIAIAKASPAVPLERGTPKPEDKWSLHDMIKIATDIRMLPADRANTFDQVLRDYRNFVHPRKESRSAHPCGAGEALMAKGALDALCDHLDRTLP